MTMQRPWETRISSYNSDSLRGTGATALSSFFDKSSDITLACPAPSSLTLTGLVPSLYQPSASFELRQSYIANAKVISGVSVQAGDLIVVGLYQDGVQVATSCADDASNSYSEAGERHITDGAGCGVYLYYAKANSTGSITITGTMAGSGYNLIFVHVYSGTFGTDPLHAVQTKGETVRSTNHTSASVTTSVSNAILFCLWGEPSGAGTISENGSGFTERREDAGTASYDRIVSATGTYADVITSTVSCAMASVLAAFIGSSGGTFLSCPSPSAASLTALTPSLALSLGSQGTASLSLSSQQANLRNNLVPGTSSLSLAALVPQISKFTPLACPAPGTISLTSSSTSLKFTVVAPLASASLQSLSPGLAQGTILYCPAQSSLALSALGVTLSTSLGAPVPSFASLSPLTPTRVVETRVLCPTPNGLSIQTNASTIRTNLGLPVSQTLGLTGQLPLIARTLVCLSPINLTLTPNAHRASLSLGCPKSSDTVLSSISPRLSIILSNTSGPQSLVFSTQPPSLATAKSLLAPTSSLVLAASSPSISHKLVPGTANLAIDSYAAEIGTASTIQVPQGWVSINSSVPSLIVYSNTKLYIPDHTYYAAFKNRFSCRIQSPVLSSDMSSPDFACKITSPRLRCSVPVVQLKEKL